MPFQIPHPEEGQTGSENIHLPALKEHLSSHVPDYNKAQDKFKDLHSTDQLKHLPEGIGDPNEQGKSWKLWFKTKGEPNDKHIIKDFHEAHYNRDISRGWAEMATKSLYHAGGIGHLIHNVHVSHLPTDQTESHPFVTINMAHKHLPLEDSYDLLQGLKNDIDNPESVRKAHEVAVGMNQINTMDYLTDNRDRHGLNMMISPEGNPLAIDHGHSFNGQSPNDFRSHYLGHSNKSVNTGISTPEAFHETADWWLKNKNRIQSDFNQLLNKTIVNPAVRDAMHDRFTKKFNMLDKFHSRAYQNIPYINAETDAYKNRDYRDAEHENEFHVK